VTARYVGARSLRAVEQTRDAHCSRSRLRRAACVLATTAASTIALVAPAAATTETFNFTGAAQTWTVPEGVSSATFDVFGAEGASGSSGSAFGPGGLGGRATVTVAVSPGQTFQINIGGAGSGVTGGFNGGANGGVFGVSSGGGGGGASDVRTGSFALDDRVIVAGGGGGGGNTRSFIGGGTQLSFGGGGGGLTGGDGGGVGNFPEPGTGGTQTAGGTGGGAAGDGVFGAGGAGACSGIACGGGGGGGWWGGGGGVHGAGGGSGFGPAGVVFESGVRSGNGLATVSYATIADLIDSVEALDLPRGLENSLLKKLENAQRNFAAGKLNGACGKLGAFINQVKAQSGKKIAAADADDLIAEAEAVRAGLGCGSGASPALKGRRQAPGTGQAMSQEKGQAAHHRP
jgi:hypothetical protein